MRFMDLAKAQTPSALVAPKISIGYLDKLRIEATFLSSIEDADELLIKVWQVLSKANQNELLLISKIDFPLLFLKATLSSLVFRQSIQNILSTREEWAKKRQDLNLLEKRQDYSDTMAFIKIALEIAFLPFAFLEAKSDAKAFRSTIKEILKNCLSKNEKNGIQRVAFTCNEALAHLKYEHKIRFPRYISTNELFTWLKNAAVIGKALIVFCIQIETIGECFMRADIDSGKRGSPILSDTLKNIYNVTHVFDSSLKSAQRIFSQDAIRRTPWNHFVDSYLFANERILIEILKMISRDFHEGNFHQNILKKVDSATGDLASLNELAKSYLQAFGSKKDGEYEWANKIYLNTVKLLAVLSALKIAKISKWQIDVAVRELNIWLQQTHEIVNRYYLYDDWTELLPYLQKDLEDKEVEWKSSFYVPLSGNSLHRKEKQLTESIADSIIAMLNTNGGTIIVGFIEKFNVVHDELKPKMQKRSRYNFFSITEELDNLRISLDDVRRDLQEYIANLSGTKIGQFDDYWLIDPIYFYCQDNLVLNCRIAVQKLEQPLISSKASKIFIRKRTNGRNVDIDPRDEFELQKRKEI